MKRNYSLKMFMGIVFMALSLCVLSTSCSKDDENEVSEKDVVGLWHFVNLTTDIENPTNKQALEEEKGLMTFASLLLQGSTIEFKSNKTLTLKLGGETATGTYSNSGGKLTINLDNGNTVSSTPDLTGASVIIKDNVLTITAPQDLDEEHSSYDKTTYRQEGFTKYVMRLNFKK